MIKCMAPWTNIDISPLGNISPCCKFRMSHYDEKFNVAENKIEEYSNSIFLENVKQEFTNNVWPKGCERCKKEEESGIESKRILDYKRWGQDYKKYTNDKKFITGSVAFGNTCQLKCIICGPVSSSKWRKEYKDIYGIDTKSLEHLDDQFAQEIYNAMPDAIHIDIPGGEPFLSMTKIQKNLLQKYIDNGIAKNICLHYTTNAQIFPDEEWWLLWMKFKQVDIQLSIDGTGQQYEYVRFPADWNTLETNAKKYVSYSKGFIKNLKLSVSHTISAYNIFYLDSFYIWCLGIGLGKPYFGYVHEPYHIQPTIWPKQINEKIIDKLSKTKFCSSPVKFLEKNNDSRLFDKFLELTEKHDDYRGISFYETFPELGEMINGI